LSAFNKIFRTHEGLNPAIGGQRAVPNGTSRITDTLVTWICFAMKPRTKRILVLIAGWSFILLGIVGLILPFLQGVLFILIGLIILSSQYAWARLLLAKLRKRFPKIGRVADQGTARATTWLKRLSCQRNTD
jgi:uncharacterized protein